MDRTRRAEIAVAECDTVVGYGRYVDAIADLTVGKKVIRGGMRREVERVREALRLAAAGRTVALVSSGDPGIYGMAGLAVELAREMNIEIPIDIVSGVTAASAAAAALGAPLMTDFAVVSLSDLLVPRQQILARLEALAHAGFVTVLYNPRGRARGAMLGKALAIFRRHLPDQTPVGIVADASDENQRVVLTDLGHVDESGVDMRTIVVIGNKDTLKIDRRMVTRRGYEVAT
ncbi:MAG: precorrin-3B C(17)-methyltransferase [Verrucomicrobiota bacterium]|nr:precorrin-3B C(17)-methyltransferase [Verrucomicrobiota bacterium]